MGWSYIPNHPVSDTNPRLAVSDSSFIQGQIDSRPERSITKANISTKYLESWQAESVTVGFQP